MKKIAEILSASLEELMARDTGANVRWHHERVTAAMIRNALMRADDVGGAAMENARASLDLFLKRLAPLAGPDPDKPCAWAGFRFSGWKLDTGECAAWA